MQEVHSKYKDIDRLKLKGWKKVIQITKNRKAVVAVLILHKVLLRISITIRDNGTIL